MRRSSRRESPDFTYLAYYVYSELPPRRRPAATSCWTLKDYIPKCRSGDQSAQPMRSTCVFQFYASGRQIESDFDPSNAWVISACSSSITTVRTANTGSGQIYPITATAYRRLQFCSGEPAVQMDTHKKPTFSGLPDYQQGWRAPPNVTSPRSTSTFNAPVEGRKKAEARWYSDAIWNTQHRISKTWKSVDTL